MSMTPEKFIEELNKPSLARQFKKWNKIINGLKKDRKLKNLLLNNIHELLVDPRLKKDQITKILESN